MRQFLPSECPRTGHAYNPGRHRGDYSFTLHSSNTSLARRMRSDDYEQEQEKLRKKLLQLNEEINEQEE